MNDLIFATITSVLLASEWLRIDKPRRAIAELAHCRSRLPHLSQHFWGPEVFRLEGVAATALGRHADGAASLRTGVDLAARTGARELEDRCVASLAAVSRQ